MQNILVHHGFAHNAILARLLLLGQGNVERMGNDVLFHLPGGDQVQFTGQHEPMDHMQLLAAGGRPLSHVLSAVNADMVSSLMHNVDLSLLSANPNLPRSFFDLADAVGRDISSGMIPVQHPLYSLNVGTLGQKFFASVPSISPDLLPAWDRVRQDISQQVSHKNHDVLSLIHWHSWQDRLERSVMGMDDDALEVDGYTWTKVATRGGQEVLNRRRGITPLEGLRGDASILLFRRTDSIDVYFLENALGELEMVGNVDKDTGQVIVVGRPHWQDKDRAGDTMVETLVSSLQTLASASSPAPR